MSPHPDAFYPTPLRSALQVELANVHGFTKVQRLAVYARIFAAELLGTVLAAPFGLRAFSLHRSLPDARRAGQRAGTVSILRDVRWGPSAGRRLLRATARRHPPRAIWNVAAAGGLLQCR